MIITDETLKKYEGKILKVILENGNFLRGRFIDFVKEKDKLAIIIQSNTYTFQIDQKDIKEIEVIADKIW